MQKSDKQKSDKDNEDVIEGSATIIDEATPKSKSSSKTASKKAKPDDGNSAPHAASPASSSFPKLAFAAVIMAVVSLGASFYLGMMVLELQSTVEQNTASAKTAQQQANQTQEQSKVALQNLKKEADENNAKIASDFKKLMADFEIVKAQTAQSKEASQSVGSAPVALSAVMVIWADAQKGERLDGFVPLVASLPASQAKTSLSDILALAGTSSHQSLMQSAAAIRHGAQPAMTDDKPEGIMDDFTNWLGEFLNLRPLDEAVETQLTSKLSASDRTGSGDDAAVLTSLESWLDRFEDSDADEAVSWRLEAQARLKADEALNHLLQALISQQIKGTTAQ